VVLVTDRAGHTAAKPLRHQQPAARAELIKPGMRTPWAPTVATIRS
jgi:hypothetical protein